MVNIPAGVPHAFKNMGKKTANLVVIFPTTYGNMMCWITFLLNRTQHGPLQSDLVLRTASKKIKPS